MVYSNGYNAVIKISARFDFWADCFFLILNNGKLLVTPNKVYAGINKIDLTKDTVYKHPTTKQCNYAYVHPTSKQCTWTPDASGLLWEKLLDINFTLNWSRNTSNRDDSIGKSFSLNSYSTYPYLKIVLNSASIGSLYQYTYSGNTETVAVGYTFNNVENPYFSSDSFALSNGYTLSHNTTQSNITLTPLTEYKSVSSQQPWIRFSDGKYGKLINMTVGSANNGTPSYKAFENAVLHVFFAWTSGTGFMADSTGTNAHINATLYGSKF